MESSSPAQGTRPGFSVLHKRHPATEMTSYVLVLGLLLLEHPLIVRSSKLPSSCCWLRTL